VARKAVAILRHLLTFEVELLLINEPNHIERGITLKRVAARFVIFGFLLIAASQSWAQKRSVAITFDDLPGIVHAKGEELTAIQETNRKILQVLTKHHVPATGFVIGTNVLDRGQVNERVAILQDWLSAGMELGNHTYSHLDLNTVAAGPFERDTIRGEGALRPVLEKNSRTLRFLRYPYNHTGDTEAKKQEVQRFLADHKYEIATSTVENYDWTFDVVYFDNEQNHDTAGMQRVRAAYLATTEESFGYYEKLSMQVFGREFPQVMLMHVNRLNADALDDVLSLIEKRGYRFVSLAEAQSDPAYTTRDAYVGPDGRMWAYRWAPSKGRKADFEHRRVPPRWVLNEYVRLTR
jgi:peptidoglycan/xylan/chitin deacetylase (PgdA/CDA1 family)